jgi:hypothetical protein
MAAFRFLRRWVNVGPAWRPRGRADASGGRIIITGTGRAGTTFLVQLFSFLGFDTGFCSETAMAAVDRISHAGLEHCLTAEPNPYVIKSPWFAEELLTALAEGRVAVRAAIVPVRDLVDAAESRRRVCREAAKEGFDPLSHSGALWLTADPAAQEAKLAEAFHRAIYALVKYEIPIYFAEFPRLALDAGHLYRSLEPLLDEHGVTREEFVRAHRAAARPEFIHMTERRPVDAH